MNAILIVRQSGPRTTAHLQGCDAMETSVDALCLLASERSKIAGLTYGAVILEDMRREDVPAMAWRAISAGIREGVSCPVVTRWTRPNTEGSL